MGKRGGGGRKPRAVATRKKRFYKSYLIVGELPNEGKTVTIGLDQYPTTVGGAGVVVGRLTAPTKVPHMPAKDGCISRMTTTDHKHSTSGLAAPDSSDEAAPCVVADESADTTREILHELSQPLTAIRTFGAVALRSLGEAPESEKLIRLRHTLNQMVDASKLATGILTRFREENKRRKLQTEVLDIHTLVRSAVQLLAHPVEEKRIELYCRPVSARVDVDPVQLQEVLINLIRNAIEAVDEAGGRVDVEVIHKDGFVEVSVADNGCGIPDEVRDRLFLAVRSKKQNGMGIGLAVSKSIVESHGGRIWCTSPPDGGAKFHFTLPDTLDVE